MSDWRVSSPAVRRRSGAPNNHYDSVGPRPRVSLPTPEEALAGMARVGSPRIPMGTSMVHDFVNTSGAPLRGTLTPRGNKQSGGAVYENQTIPPASPGTPANRTNIPQERLGAQYRVSAYVPAPIGPEAAPTQANGRIITSAITREGNFGDAMGNAYRQ
jgi:hypothetical protein